MKLWKKGTERPQALYHQPSEYNPNSNLSICEGLRVLSRIASLESLRLESSGKMKESWSLHRAILRSSRHSGMNGCLMERLVGCAIYAVHVLPVLEWAADSRVDELMLRDALSELDAINRMTPPMSHGLRAEYFSLCNTIETLPDGRQGFNQTTEDLRRHFEKTFPDFTHDVNWEAFNVDIDYLQFEPDLSNRVLRMIFANWLSQFDMLRHERSSKFTSENLVIFDTRKPLNQKVGNFSLTELMQWFNRSTYCRIRMPDVFLIDEVIVRDKTRQAGLEIALALQLYQRKQGHFPNRLEDLTGGYLSRLPVDPFGTGHSLSYRRDEKGAIVWSARFINFDQQWGDGNWDGKKDLGTFVFRVIDSEKQK